MVTQTIKRLAETRAKLTQLEQTVEVELREELAALPEQYGFDDLKSFIKALRSAARGGSKRKGRGPGRPPKAKIEPKKRRRALITDETRALVKKLAKAGKTGAQIAKEVGISLPSVQNIKKALGLVKARGAKTAKPAPTPKKPAKKVKKGARKAAKKPTAAPAAPTAPAPEAPKAE